MSPQRTLIFESSFILLVLCLLILLLLLFLLLVFLSQFVYLATAKMICEFPFIFEILVAVAALELYCR